MAGFVTVPIPLRVPSAWRGRVFGARALSHRAGAFVTSASASEDEPSSENKASLPSTSAPRLLPYVTAFAVFGLAGNSFGPMLPSLAEQAGVSTVALSPVMLAAGLGGLAGVVLCPLLPLSKLLPGGLAALGATFALVPLATSVPAMAGIFALASVCSQGVAIGGHALLARQPRASAGLNSINAAFGAGSLAAPLLHSSLAPAFACLQRGGAASYWAVAALLCAASIPFMLVATPADERAAPRPVATSADERAAPRPASKPPLSVSMLVSSLGGTDRALLTASVMGLVLCCVGAEACYGVWLYTYASQSMQLPATFAAATVSTFWTALTAGRLLAVAASARVPPSIILRSSLPFAVIGPLAALAMPTSPAALTAGVACAGFGLSCGFANAVALLARHVPPTGSTQAMIQLAACSGGLVFAPLVAQLQSAGVIGSSGFLLVAGVCATGNIAFLATAEAIGSRLTRQSIKHRAAAEP